MRGGDKLAGFVVSVPIMDPLPSPVTENRGVCETSLHVGKLVESSDPPFPPRHSPESLPSILLLPAVFIALIMTPMKTKVSRKTLAGAAGDLLKSMLSPLDHKTWVWVCFVAA